MAKEAYEAGIREAAPDAPFSVTTRVGAVLGQMARTHAPDKQGSELLVWYRETAREFRRATATNPQYWGGWAPYHCARWLTMGKPQDKRAYAFQPSSGRALAVKKIRVRDL